MVKRNENGTWLKVIVQALINLGGQATLKDICTEVEKLIPSYGLSKTKYWDNTVSCTIAEHSNPKDSPKYKNTDKIFKKTSRGIWKLSSINQKTNTATKLQKREKETWVDSITQAFKNLGGNAHYSILYPEVKKIRDDQNLSWPKTAKQSIQERIEAYSSDSEHYQNKEDRFKLFGPKSSGHWGLRNFTSVIKPTDYDELDTHNRGNKKVALTVTRYIRDSSLSKSIKNKEQNKCQICDISIKLPNGNFYCEAHHIKPLGKGHEGDDKQDNIIIVCPSCHAKLDYLVEKIDFSKIIQRNNQAHKISEEFIDYHNSLVDEAYK